MIARINAEGDIIYWIGGISFQDRHRGVRNYPFTVIGIVITVLGDIASVGNKNNIVDCLIAGNPASLGIEIVITAGIDCIKLGIRNGDNGEVLAGCAGFLPSVERNLQDVIIWVCDMYLQHGCRRYIGRPICRHDGCWRVRRSERIVGIDNLGSNPIRQTGCGLNFSDIPGQTIKKQEEYYGCVEPPRSSHSFLYLHQLFYNWMLAILQ